jgi:WD40 repeat protein
MDFSPDGLRLASSFDNHTLQVTDLRTGQAVVILRGLEHSVTSIAFSPDGQFMFSRSEESDVLIWNAKTFALESKEDQAQGGSVRRRPQSPWEPIFCYDESTHWLTTRDPDCAGQPRRLSWVPKSRQRSIGPLGSFKKVVVFGSDSGIVTVMDFSTYPYFPCHLGRDNGDT